MALATDRGLTVEARAASDLSPFRYSAPDGADDVTITLIESARSLEALGLSPGRLTETPDGICFTRTLPTDGTVYRLDLDTTNWSTAAGLGPDLEGYRFLVPCPCLDLHLVRAQSLSIPTEAGGRIAGTVLKDAWFGFTQVEGAIRLDLSDTSTGTLLGPLIPSSSSVYRAWTDASDQIWIHSSETVHRWDGQSAPELIAENLPSTQGDDFTGASGASQGLDYELFLAGQDGRTLRQTAARSEAIHDGIRLGKDPSQSGSVAMLGPGRAAFGVHDDVAIGRYDEDGVSTKPGPGSIVSMLSTPMGILVGGRYGHASIIDPVTLEYAELRGLEGETAVGRGSIDSMALFGTGAVAVSRDGFIAQIVPDLGLCPPIATTGFVEIRSVSVHGEELVLAGGGREGTYRVEIWRPR